MNNINHIALFVRYLQMGGVGQVTVQLANALVSEGNIVDLIVAKGEGPLQRQLSAKVRVIDLQAGRMWQCLNPLRRYLRLHRPDALISAQERTNLIATIGWFTAGRKERLLLVEHTNLECYLEVAPLWYRIGLPLLLRFLYPRASAVAGVSRGVAETVAKYSGIPHDKVQVLYNPVISPEVFEAAREDPGHKWLSSGEYKVVLGVGRLSPEKNYALLLRAFARAYELDSRLRLLILGDGKLRHELDELAEEKGLREVIDLPGYTRNPYAFMARADLFVNSSNFEGLPTVLIEALACGCPVVSTDCPSGPREILEDGRWGRLVPVGDEETLAEAMLESLAQERDREAYRSRGSFFSVDRAVEAYLRVLFPWKSFDSVSIC